MAVQIRKSEQVVVAHSIDQKCRSARLEIGPAQQGFTDRIEQPVGRAHRENAARFEDAPAFRKQRLGIVDLLEAVPNEDGLESGIRKTALRHLAFMNRKAFSTGEARGVFSNIDAFGAPAPFLRGLEESAVV